jgi:pilus assembly protein TadC
MQISALAATALTLLMLLANIYHITYGEFFVLPMSGSFFILLAFLAYGRWKMAPFSC